MCLSFAQVLLAGVSLLASPTTSSEEGLFDALNLEAEVTAELRSLPSIPDDNWFLQILTDVGDSESQDLPTHHPALTTFDSSCLSAPARALDVGPAVAVVAVLEPLPAPTAAEPMIWSDTARGSSPPRLRPSARGPPA